jgi:pyruvate-ferredoxin/flavodoxin oxidoreductase
LYRYKPSTEHGEHPFQLDSAAPTIPLRDFALKEARYGMLARSDPRRSETLLQLAQHGIDERWHYYEQLAGVERVMHRVDHTASTAGETDDEPDAADGTEPDDG